MFDARFVIAHALWIFGAATCLAAFGYVRWEARVAQARLRDVMRASRGWRLFRTVGVLLIASGLILVPGTPAWARAAWAVVFAAAAFDLWQERSA